MTDHFCVYITSFAVGLVYCGRLAPIRHETGCWYCAEHFDIITDPANRFIDSGGGGETTGRSLKYSD